MLVLPLAPLVPLVPLVPLDPLAPLELPPDDVALALPPLAVPEAPPLVEPPTLTLVFPAVPPEFALLPPVADEVVPAVAPLLPGAPLNVLVQPDSTRPAAASVVAKLTRRTISQLPIVAHEIDLCKQYRSG